jgi:hypothetical protein
MMKKGVSLGVGLFVIGVLIGIIQLWFELWSMNTFIKLEMTLGALILIVCVIFFVAKEYKDNKTNRNGDHLD